MNLLKPIASGTFDQPICTPFLTSLFNSSKIFFRKVTSYAGFSALAYLTILMLFSRQAERSRTPSGISRVSKWTFLSQATMDSVSFAGHITFAIMAEGRPSVSLIAPAFLACMLFVQQAVSPLRSDSSITEPSSWLVAILCIGEYDPRPRKLQIGRAHV